MTNVQDRPLWNAGALTSTFEGNEPAGFGPVYRVSPLAGGDSLQLAAPPQNFSANLPANAGNPFGAILQQLASLLTQLLSMFGLQSGGAAGQYFQNADAASAGDPHLSFSGECGGGAEQAHFESMSGHENLLSSGSFEGGYRVSTQVTQPGANGVTYNREATVTTNYGRTQISLDNAGNAGITQDGQTYALQPGAHFDLGNGESVERANDGSVTVTQRNAQGGLVAATMRENGRGVDVSVHAHDVDLQGDLPSAARAHFEPSRRKPEGAEPPRHAGSDWLPD